MKSCTLYHVPKPRSLWESGGLPAPLMLGVKDTSSLRWVPLCFSISITWELVRHAQSQAY